MTADEKIRAKIARALMAVIEEIDSMEKRASKRASAEAIILPAKKTEAYWVGQYDAAHKLGAILSEAMLVPVDQDPQERLEATRKVARDVAEGLN